MNAPDDVSISYDIVRSQRSTADIIVERDGSVLVRAPEWVDDECVAVMVQSRRYWIYRSLAEWRDLNATRIIREYKSGEGFLYLGRTYRLRIVGRQDEPLKLKDGRFLLQRALAESGDMDLARDAFRRFFTRKGRAWLCKRADYYAPKIDVTITDVDVRELGHRWASCSSSGHLAFHWKCMMAPPSVLDYIVVHELCHLRHRDHGQAFWNEVDKVLPDYRERKEWLKARGASLDV